MWRFVLVLGMVLIWGAPTRAELLQIPIACAPAEFNENILRDKYKEEAVAVGVTNGNSLVELWRSEENDTWTLMLRMTDGQLCMFSAGSGWRDLPAVPEGVDS